MRVVRRAAYSGWGRGSAERSMRRRAHRNWFPALSQRAFPPPTVLPAAVPQPEESIRAVTRRIWQPQPGSQTDRRTSDDLHLLRVNLWQLLVTLFASGTYLLHLRIPLIVITEMAKRRHRSWSPGLVCRRINGLTQHVNIVKLNVTTTLT